MLANKDGADGADGADEQKPLLVSQIITPYNINSIKIAHSANYSTCNIYNINDTDNYKKEFKLYPTRWWILFLFSMLSAQQSILWITYGAVADTAEDYYKKTAGQINFLCTLGPIAFIPLATFTSWAIGEYGLRKTVFVAALICAIGAVIRCFATGDTFWIVIIAQFLNAASGPVVMGAPPALSAAWFGKNERTFATAISSLSNYLGTAFGFVFGLFIDTNKQLQNLLYIEALCSVIILIGVIVYFPDSPPTAPSATAGVKTQHVSFKASVTSLLRETWGVLRQKDGLVLVLVGGLVPGVYGGWGAMIVSILGPLGFSQAQSQWIATASTVTGMVAGLFVGYIHDRVKNFKIMMISFVALMSITFAVFTAATSQIIHFNFIEILLTSALGGILVNSLYPIAFEALVEVTYPIKEEVGASLNTLLNNVACFFFLIVGNYIPAMWMNCIVVITAAAATFAMFLVKEEYKRFNIDQSARVIPQVTI